MGLARWLRFVFLLCLVSVGGLSCKGREIKEEKPQSGFISVPTPSDVFTLRDGESLTVRGTARLGESSKVVLPLGSLREVAGKFEEVYLVNHGARKVERYEVQGDELVANLVGGETYVLLPVPTGNLADVYRTLCRLDRVSLIDQNVVLDRICFEILCVEELFMADLLIEKLPELIPHKEYLSMSGVQFGGWGGGFGNVCQRCTSFRPGGIYPTDECFDLELPPAPDTWKADVINMIPKALSGEANQDSEPFLAIDRTDPDCLVGSAFTPSPTSNTLAPTFVSSTAGKTWVLNDNVPSQIGTGDITMDSGAAPGELYTGILRVPSPPNSTDMRTLVTSDFKSSTVMTELEDHFNGDQPFVEVGANVVDDRVYVGFNDLTQFSGGGGTGRTARVDVSLDSGASFTSVPIEFRSTGSAGQDGPSIRPTVAADGTVYAAYFGWRASVGAGFSTDIVVVRDDSGGTGANPFQDLTDASDGLPGRLVATGRTVNWGGSLGQNRTGSNLSLAVDPNDSSRVFIAWADVVGTSTSTLHVRSSMDRGVTWSGDLVTFKDATNGALAVNDSGQTAVLFQQVFGTGASARWMTTVRIFPTQSASGQTLNLARTPVSQPAPTFQPYLGDYAHMIHDGNEFIGIFSAGNFPDLANFPSGVSYQRNANFSTKVLTNTGGGTVPVSIDPYFFRLELR